MTLLDYARSEGRKPFDLGSTSCAHFMAGWVVLRTGRDGLAIFGGLPADVSADLLARRKLAWAVIKGCRSIGLKRTREPVAGDIGIIRMSRASRPVAGLMMTETIDRCAVRSASGWMHRDEAGVHLTIAAAAELLIAWSVV